MPSRKANNNVKRRRVNRAGSSSSSKGSNVPHIPANVLARHVLPHLNIPNVAAWTAVSRNMRARAVPMLKHQELVQLIKVLLKVQRYVFQKHTGLEQIKRYLDSLPQDKYKVVWRAMDTRYGEPIAYECRIRTRNFDVAFQAISADELNRGMHNRPPRDVLFVDAEIHHRRWPTTKAFGQLAAQLLIQIDSVYPHQYPHPISLRIVDKQFGAALRASLPKYVHII